MTTIVPNEDLAATSPAEGHLQPTPSNVQELSTKGWRSPLAALVTALLVIEGVTGLWIYAAPFSITSQVQLLVHVVAGLVMIVPYLIYQVRHFLAWYSQKASVVMVVGYLLGTMVLVNLATGLVLTWQAAMGPKLSPSWDIVHLVSGIALCALVVA